MKINIIRKLKQKDTRSPSFGLNKQFFILLVLGIGFLLANFSIIHAMVADFKGVAETVNVSGKLRMLNRELALRAVLQQSSEQASPAVKEVADDFEQALRALETGGEAFGYNVHDLGAVAQSSLSDLRGSWELYRSSIQAAALRGTGAEARVGWADESRLLLSKTEGLIDVLIREINQVYDRVLIRLYFLSFLCCVLFSALFIVVRRRLVSPLMDVARKHERLASGHYDVRSDYHSPDEVGELCQSFNVSAAKIGELVTNLEAERLNLWRAETMFRGMAENSIVGIYVVKDGRFVFVNPKMADIFKYPDATSMTHTLVEKVVAPEDYPEIQKSIDRRLRGRLEDNVLTVKGIRTDGSAFDMRIFGSRMSLAGETVTMGVILDITQEVRVRNVYEVISSCGHAMVRESPEAELLDEVCGILADIAGYNSATVACCYDAEKSAVTVSSMRVRGGGREYSEAAGKDMDWVLGVAWLEATLESGASRLIGSEEMPFVPVEWRSLALASDADTMLFVPLMAAHRLIGVLVLCSSGGDTFSDEEIKLIEDLAGMVSQGVALRRMDQEQSRQQERLEFMATHDSLTGLPNRLYFNEQLLSETDRVDREGTRVALLLLDLDDFKLVNDSLGHEAGDQLLVVVAELLRGAVRRSDTVARLGGDEFAIILSDVRDEREVELVAHNLLRVIDSPIKLRAQTVYVGASIGISQYPEDGPQEELLKCADLAMYHVKHGGRNRCGFYNPEMDIDNKRRLLLANDLRQALTERQLSLLYQPRIDLQSESLVSVEALLRWRHPALGWISPEEFIPVAEDHGLIVDIGEWVLRRACADVARWQKLGGSELRVSVNLSAIQIGQSDFVDQVHMALSDSGIRPERLELELTESVLMRNMVQAERVLSRIKALGVKLSIDDFGTGYSSLNYLKQLPLDIIKLDKSFVNNVSTNKAERAIVETIVSLGKTLGLRVVAEGVETTAQLKQVERIGCHEVQGYLVGRPMTVPAFEERLHNESLPWV